MAHRNEATMTASRNASAATEWMSIADVARLFGTSKQTVTKWLRTGEMDFLRRESTIRIPRAAVDKFINANLASIAAKQAAMDAAQ